MQHRLMTEYEWRKQAGRARRRADWVGAQCVYPSKWRRMTQSRCVRLAFVMLTALAAVILPLVTGHNMPEVFDSIAISDIPQQQARHVSAVTYALPQDLTWQTHVFTREQLIRGKMMLLDDTHPLPDDVYPPNTASIARYGNGMVPVRSLGLKAGRETIDALQQLFAVLRQKNIEGIYVCQGTTTAAEQRTKLIDSLRGLMPVYPPEQARQIALVEEEQPGTGELMQEYTVELCLIDAVTHQQDHRQLEESVQGQALIQYAWRYGFVRSNPKYPYRFRYVGKAHATAMTYLDLSLEEYLEWLHQKQVLAISAGGRMQYLILCQPIRQERIAFDLPENALFEVSLDNMGYAVAACTL